MDQPHPRHRRRELRPRLRGLLEPLLLTVRPATPDDAAAIDAVDRAVHRAGVGVVSLEADLPPEEVVRARLRPDPFSACFVALEGERVVGEAHVQRLRASFLRHVGVLAIGVHPNAQRRGHGLALMRACLDWCRARAMTRVELYVRADNPGAHALYRRLGFEVEGVRRDFVRLPDGTTVDDLVMVTFLTAPPDPC